MTDNSLSCSICNSSISDFKYHGMKEWNISGYLCSDCYSKKLTEYYIKRDVYEDKK